MEGRILVLWHFLHLAVEFRRGSLIDAAGVGHSQLTDGLQYAQHTYGVDIGCELRRVERYLYVTLGSEVIDFRRAHLADDAQDAHRVAEVGIVQVEVGQTLQMGNTLAEVYRRTADSAVNFISFLK